MNGLLRNLNTKIKKSRILIIVMYVCKMDERQGYARKILRQTEISF